MTDSWSVPGANSGTLAVDHPPRLLLTMAASDCILAEQRSDDSSDAGSASGAASGSDRSPQARRRGHYRGFMPAGLREDLAAGAASGAGADAAHHCHCHRGNSGLLWLLALGVGAYVLSRRRSS